MKSFFAIMLLLCVSISYTYAGEEYEKDENKQSTKMEDREVIYYDHDLELELEASNGTVYAEWDEFNLDEPKDFEWYKLVYSTSKTNPVYPDDEAVFIGKIDQTEAKFRLQKGSSTHYVRLCAVILNDNYSKDRYCGKAQTITGEYVDQYKKEETDKYEEEKKEYTKKVEEKKEYVKKEVKTSTLSSAMKMRIDSVIENFVGKLEDKGYSEAQMTSAINTVISRLGEFKNKAGYKYIVHYMIEVLEEYRDEYSNPLEDLESIFDGL